MRSELFGLIFYEIYSQGVDFPCIKTIGLFLFYFFLVICLMNDQILATIYFYFFPVSIWWYIYFFCLNVCLSMNTEPASPSFIIYEYENVWKKEKQGDLDDAREITAVWCWNVKKINFVAAILDFGGLSQSILTKFGTHITFTSE